MTNRAKFAPKRSRFTWHSAALSIAASSFVACSVPADDPGLVDPVPQGLTVPVSKPFPANTSGAAACPTCMKVSNVTQAQLNTDIGNAYNKWKAAIVAQWTVGDLKGQYYIAGGANGAVDGYTAISSSEAMGYGMVIFPLMAGFDPSAKAYFDSLDTVRKSLPSSGDARLMNWALPKNGKINVTKNPPATDGDMDMAYGLLLAYNQWGDATYLTEAKSVLAGIEARYITSGSGSFFARLNIGDPDHTTSLPSAVWNGTTYYEQADHTKGLPFLSRPSDYMIDHMRAFKAMSGNAIWTNVENASLAIMQAVRHGTTGLVPDFIVNTIPQASKTGTGDENLCTWCFDYNSCRVPWRQAMAFAHYGVPGAKDVASKMATWAATTFAGNPACLPPEMQLDGTPVNGTTCTNKKFWNDASFTSPMIAAGITNTSSTTNQNWLNNGWVYMKDSTNWLSKPVKVDDDYFGSTLNLMSMILVSGNWWVPHS